MWNMERARKREKNYAALLQAVGDDKWCTEMVYEKKKSYGKTRKNFSDVLCNEKIIQRNNFSSIECFDDTITTCQLVCLFRFSFRSLSSTTKPNGTELHSSSRRALCAGLKVVSNDSIARAPWDDSFSGARSLLIHARRKKFNGRSNNEDAMIEWLVGIFRDNCVYSMRHESPWHGACGCFSDEIRFHIVSSPIKRVVSSSSQVYRASLLSFIASVGANEIQLDMETSLINLSVELRHRTPCPTSVCMCIDQLEEKNSESRERFESIHSPMAQVRNTSPGNCSLSRWASMIRPGVLNKCFAKFLFAEEFNFNIQNWKSSEPHEKTFM